MTLIIVRRRFVSYLAGSLPSARNFDLTGLPRGAGVGWKRSSIRSLNKVASVRSNRNGHEKVGRPTHLVINFYHTNEISEDRAHRLPLRLVSMWGSGGPCILNNSNWFNTWGWEIDSPSAPNLHVNLLPPLTWKIARSLGPSNTFVVLRA